MVTLYIGLQILPLPGFLLGCYIYNYIHMHAQAQLQLTQQLMIISEFVVFYLYGGTIAWWKGLGMSDGI